MSQTTVTKTAFARGVWSGVVFSKDEPKIRVAHEGRDIEGVELTKTEKKSEWELKFALPLECIGDGTQTFTIEDTLSGDILESVTMLSGDVLLDDVRVEMSMLRAEVNMLKGIIRRHLRRHRDEQTDSPKDNQTGSKKDAQTGSKKDDEKARPKKPLNVAIEIKKGA